MESEIKGRLIILSGPSCVGKSPLTKALIKFHYELWKTLKPLVLYNSRLPRPGEIDGEDYFFRTKDEIEKFRKNEKYAVMDVRGDLQALDIDELRKSLKQGSVFFEGNPFTGRILQTHPKLEKIDKLSIFMSPLSKEEIQFLEKSGALVPDLVADVMRRKLLRRTKRQKGILSLEDLRNIEKRASSAYEELKEAHNFQYVIPNHDGEDSENWDAFYYPLGDARLSLLAFVSLVKGENSQYAESWENNLIV